MLKNNKVNLLISIVAAIALWGYVTLAVNPQTDGAITSIPVELTNLEALYDKGLTIADASTYTVDVEVSGTRSEVIKLTAADFRATADMTGYPKGSNNVAVKVITAANVEISRIRPETIPVTVVDRITVTKPVRLAFADEFKKGEEPGFITIAPAEMEVSGTITAVDSVAYIRAEIPEGMLSEESLTIKLDAVAISRDGQPVYSVGLSQDQVEVTATLCSTKTVPLRINITGETPETVEVTYKYVPSTITIRGTKDAIKDILEIHGRDVNLRQIVDTTEIPVDPYLPSGVETADDSDGLVVKIEVQGIENKELEFTADMIEIVGLPDRLIGHVNTGVITVAVFATAETLSEVTAQTIHLSIDATEIALAAEQVEMDVITESDLDVKKITVEPAKVRVTFNKN
jgi:YbbR domain-containing protein